MLIDRILKNLRCSLSQPPSTVLLAQSISLWLKSPHMSTWSARKLLLLINYTLILSLYSGEEFGWTTVACKEKGSVLYIYLACYCLSVLRSSFSSGADSNSFLTIIITPPHAVSLSFLYTLYVLYYGIMTDGINFVSTWKTRWRDSLSKISARVSCLVTLHISLIFVYIHFKFVITVCWSPLLLCALFTLLEELPSFAGCTDSRWGDVLSPAQILTLLSSSFFQGSFH